MNMIKVLKVTTWIFIVLAAIFLWFSLRMEENNLEYTLYALAMIVAAWGTNHFLKKYE